MVHMYMDGIDAYKSYDRWCQYIFLVCFVKLPTPRYVVSCLSLKRLLQSIFQRFTNKCIVTGFFHDMDSKTSDLGAKLEIGGWYRWQYCQTLL
jgi:hypothetical protein